MIINTKQELKNLQGETLKIGEDNLTIGVFISAALSSEKLNEDMLRSYILAKKISENETVDLTADDQVFISNSIKKTSLFTPIVIGQVLEILQ